MVGTSGDTKRAVVMYVFGRLLIVLLFALGIGACIYLISTNNLTSKETSLLSMLLTILSILATWVVAHIYTESQHRKAIQDVQDYHRSNLRMYARKAAEKVDNLSKELDRLSQYLRQELEVAEYESTEDALLAREERIESSIHIIQALKSVNDTALSDWEGVIGDELEQQREERKEREEELERVITRLESLVALQGQGFFSGREDAVKLRTEIESLKSGLQTAMASLTGLPVRTKKSTKKTRMTVETACPACQENLVYTQRPRPRSVKALNCKSCGSKLMSKYSESEGFSLELRGMKKEMIDCPHCNGSIEIELDTFPGATTATRCGGCGVGIRVSRTFDGLNVQSTGIPKSALDKGEIISEEIIELVQKNLPPQPWPQLIHKEIAIKLGVSNRLVTRVIDELVRRGVFHPQIDGVLYEPLSKNPKDT